MGLVLAQKTNTMGSGGTVRLVDFGTTSTDYYTGFTSLWRLGTDGTVTDRVGATYTPTKITTAGTGAATTIATIPTASDKAYARRIDVAACKSDGTDAAIYMKAVGYRNDGGTLTIIGALQSIIADQESAGATGYSVTVATSGTNLLVQSPTTRRTPSTGAAASRWWRPRRRTMPQTLTTPLAKTGTRWLIRSFHVFDAEFGNPAIRVELELQADDGTVVEQKSGALDFAAFVTELNSQTGTSINRLRKAILACSAAEGLIGVGTAT